MKKLVAGLLALAVVLCGLNAFAAETEQDVYFGSDNSVHIADYNSDIKNYTTVLIRKKGTTGADGVVYVDQQSKGFSDVVDFMLKAGVSKEDDVHDYTATFGNSNNDESKVVNFSVDNVTISGDVDSVTLDRANKMLVADEPISTDDEEFINKAGNGLYKKSFVFTASSGKIYDKAYIVSSDGKKCYGHFELDLSTNFTGESDIAYGIQIYNISEENKGINLYLTEMEADVQ